MIPNALHLNTGSVLMGRWRTRLDPVAKPARLAHFGTGTTRPKPRVFLYKISRLHSTESKKHTHKCVD
jgi:hypothetical protein